MRLQHYELSEIIGEGGMGVVWKGTDTRLGRTVAVKILHEHHSRDPQLRERFSREARIQASLNHPNIVTLLDYIETSDQLALVMEFVQGRSLDKVIGREVGPIVTDRALPLFNKLLDAFEYIHSQGIVHRDIKPSNAMVDFSDQVKVTDLGIAKIAGDHGLTRTGTKLGTLWYMAPEQVKGQEATKQSDIYALGVTLFEMVGGRVPFDSTTSSDYEVMDLIVKEDLPDPRIFYPHIPEYIVNIINIATSKNKNSRFSSCKRFKQAIYEENIDNTKLNNEKVEIYDASEHVITDDTNLDDVKKNESIGVGGWLGFFCFMITIIAPIFGFIVLVTDWASVSDIVLETYPGIATGMLLESIGRIIIIIWGVVVGITLWQRVPNADKKAINYFKVRLILWFALEMVVAFIIISEDISSDFVASTFGFAVGSIFSELVFFIIWYSYFKKSKRVKNTFR